MPVQLAVSLTDNRASCSTTIFTAAMLALVTELLGLQGRVSSSTENFPALKALINVKKIAFGNKEHTTDKKMGVLVLLTLQKQ